MSPGFKKMPTAVPVVLDPVMKSTSGSSLLDGASGGDIMELMRSVTLVTPNIPEAEKFTGMTIDDVSTMIAAARALLAMGCRNVLLKGGHLPADHLADVLMMEGQPPVIFESGKVATRNLHGTGCTLSSAIAAFLCYGQPLAKAVENAECYVKKAIFASKDVVVGEGNGPLAVELVKEVVDLPEDKIVCDTNVAKISVVGAGMESHPGVAAEMFEALFSRSVNIQMISTSEIKISVLLNKADGERAVEAIHEKFFETA